MKLKKQLNNILKTFSLRTIIMILCSSFLILVIAFSTIFYLTSTRQVSNMILQNSIQLTRQATANMDRKFNQIRDSSIHSITESYRFLKMSQNINDGIDAISAKDYTILAQSIQEFVHQNSPDISNVILLLSNNSIVLTVSETNISFRCQQPDYHALYQRYSNTDLNWIYKEDTSSFINHASAVPEIGLIQLLGTEQSSLHGLLYIGISNQALEKELTYYHVTNANIFTMAHNGQILLHGQNPYEFQTFLSLTEDDLGIFKNASLEQKEISFLDLTDNYALYSPMDISPLSIIAIIPKNEMFLDNDRFSSMLLTEASIAVLFCIVLFIMVTKFISAPAENLVRQVDAIESLPQLKTVHATGGKDFVQITAAINHLYSRTQQLITSLTQEMQNRKDAELKILYAQINPHFLYNTLDSISQLCELQESEAASQMIRELSDFYRIGVSKGDTWIPLKEEILHVSSYLSILKTRFGDFNYEILVPENTKTFLVPKIILQPLAENAIYHGIRTTNPGGSLIITAKIQKDSLILQVCDDGQGIEEDMLMKICASLETEDSLLEKTEGLRIYGLKNVHQRIRMQCGKPYGLTIESQLDMGTTVTLLLPIKPDHLE